MTLSVHGSVHKYETVNIIKGSGKLTKMFYQVSFSQAIIIFILTIFLKKDSNLYILFVNTMYVKML